MRLVAAVAAAAAIAGPAAAAPQRVHTLTLANMAFGPAPAALRTGDVVEWVNKDMFQHTATARNGAFDVTLPPNSRRRVVLRRAGRIEVYCRYHPGMRTVLQVGR